MLSKQCLLVYAGLCSPKISIICYCSYHNANCSDPKSSAKHVSYWVHWGTKVPKQVFPTFHQHAATLRHTLQCLNVLLSSHLTRFIFIVYKNAKRSSSFSPKYVLSNLKQDAKSFVFQLTKHVFHSVYLTCYKQSA